MNFSRHNKQDVQKALPYSRSNAAPSERNNMLKTGPCHVNQSIASSVIMKKKVVVAAPQLKARSAVVPIEPQRTLKQAGKSRIIPIRHTLTSKLRMEKVNPFLTLESVPNSSLPVKGINTPLRRATFHPDMAQMKQTLDLKIIAPRSEKKPTVPKLDANNMKRSVSKEQKPSISTSRQPNSVSTNLNRRFLKPKVQKPSFVLPQQRNPVSKIQSSSASSILSQRGPISSNLSSTIQKRSTSIQSMKTTSNVSVSSLNKPNPSVFKENKRKILSNLQSSNNANIMSLRGETLKKKKTVVPDPKILQVKPRVDSGMKRQLKSILRKSASAGDLRKGFKEDKEHGILSEIRNNPSSVSKSMNKSLKGVSFLSPLNMSPVSTLKTINTPPPAILRKRLEDWLVKRGKTSYSYHHLCCFGLQKNEIILPKNNQSGHSNDTISFKQDSPPSRLNETITLESSDSLIQDNDIGVMEDGIPNGSSTPEESLLETTEDKENNEYLCHPEALNDLRKLVVSGYSRDQCEQWLDLISASHPAVKELSQYWECVAALEEARGDFSSAVDCYGRAVVKGADAKAIDERLDDLWEKFSSLSVSATEAKHTPMKKLAVDKKQIFKSTVIKFALQQKAIKKSCKENEPSQHLNYIVTPVRRSSRRSQSLFRTTLTVKCVDTLDDLEHNIKDKMEFHSNILLTPGK